jgi:hypothetical protein
MKEEAEDEDEDDGEAVLGKIAGNSLEIEVKTQPGNARPWCEPSTRPGLSAWASRSSARAAPPA